MAGDTIITVVGNLTDDPELNFTQSGVARANFTVASTPRYFDRQAGDWKDGDTLFVRCTAWRKPAENAASSLGKGQRVIAQGSLKMRQFEREDGSKGTSVEMNIDEVGPSLRYAEAAVTRNARPGEGPPPQQTAPANGASGGEPGSGQPDPWTVSANASEAPPF